MVSKLEYTACSGTVVPGKQSATTFESNLAFLSVWELMSVNRFCPKALCVYWPVLLPASKTTKDPCCERTLRAKLGLYKQILLDSISPSRDVVKMGFG